MSAPAIRDSGGTLPRCNHTGVIHNNTCVTCHVTGIAGIHAR